MDIQLGELKLYNSDGNRLESFRPRQPEKVLMYCCGPTVYSYAHIGNLRAYTVQDVLHRILLALGYDLKHVMNITDVGHLTDDGDEGEDKVALSARAAGKTEREIADYYTQAFFRDCGKMHIIRPDVVCRASDHIADMQKLIHEIVEAGFTYYSNGNLYFDTSKLDDYGRLAGLKPVSEETMLSRTGTDSAKKSQRDFVLWFSNGKFADQAMQWDSPWGRGYPGWHIECSAMASRFLGSQIDIHCGGVDHKMVHHPNEIAQSESVLPEEQKPWVRYWLHNEFVVIQKIAEGDHLVRDGDKISKSSGNALTLAMLENRGFSALDYRYFLLGVHYRSQVQFRFQALEGAQKSRKRLRQRAYELKGQVGRLQTGCVALSPQVQKIEAKNLLNSYIKEFWEALLQDLHTPKALAALWNALKDDGLNAADKLAVLEFGEAFLQLGLFSAEADESEIPQTYLELLAERDKARLAKNYRRADELRTQLQAAGYQIVDTAQGSVLKARDY